MKKLLLILLLFQVENSAIGSRILFLFPTPSKSHMVIVHALSTALAEKGHDVTVVTTFPLGKYIDNHREIPIKFSDKVRQNMNKIIGQSPKSFHKWVSLMLETIFLQGEEIFKSKEFEEISNEKFDLIVAAMNFQNFLLGFGEKFECPVIMLSTQRHVSFTHLASSNPLTVNAAAHSNIGKFNMNFIDRVKNFIFYGMDLIFYQYSVYRQKTIYNKYFPSNKRTYEEALKNISLVFVNDHFSEGLVRPNIPSVVDIRGLQIKTNSDKLPENIQNFLDEAKDGAIYFSLGSNFKTETVKVDAIKLILSVFAKLPQRIIMKWDNENIQGKSDNIMLGKWLPQNDILAHPNVKLFISHCGLGSVVESKYHGVPILGLPLFGDQFMNAKLAVEEGWVIQMNLQTLIADDFENAIKLLIYDERYSAKVQSLSKVFRDRPLSPKRTAIYWTEYVINHNGAKHMQYAAVHQNFLERNSLDVIGFILTIIYILIKFLSLIIRLAIKIAKKIVWNDRAAIISKKLQ